MLFDDNDKETAEALRDSPVTKAQRSPAAIAKQITSEQPIARLCTASEVCWRIWVWGRSVEIPLRKTVATALAPEHRFNILTRPTPLQQKAFDLLAIPITCSQ